MKVLICLALLAAANAYPRPEFDPANLNNGPIPFEMLRNAAAFPAPVWRDNPIDAPNGNVLVAIIAFPDIPEELNNEETDSSPNQLVLNEEEQPNVVPNVENSADEKSVPVDKVKVVYAVESSPENEAKELIAPLDKVEAVYAVEPSLEKEVSAKELSALVPEVEDQLRIVKFVDEPAALDFQKIQFPLNARNLM